WGWPYRYRYAALYSTCYDPFFYDPFLCYDPIFYRPYSFGFGYGFYGYGYRPYYYGGRYGFANRPRNLFINRVRTGTGVQVTFRDRLGTNTSVGGVGPRFRVPDGALVTRRRPDATPVRERDAMQRHSGDRIAFPARDRGEVRDRGDRPDRSAPTARAPERRGGGAREGPRAAPERRGGGGGGGRRPGHGRRDDRRRRDLPHARTRRRAARSPGAHIRGLGAGRRAGVPGRAVLRRAHHAPASRRRQVRLRARGVRPSRRLRGGLG